MESGGDNLSATFSPELVNAYIVCSNGVIHLIDEVLVPFARAAGPAAVRP